MIQTLSRTVTLLLALFLATPLAAQPGARVEVHFELDLQSLLLDREPTQSAWKRKAEKVVLDAWLAELQRPDQLALWHFAAPQPGTTPEWQLKAAVVPGGVSEALLTLTLYRVLNRDSNTAETETRVILRRQGALWPPVTFGAKTAAHIDELERDVTSLLGCLMGYSLCDPKDDDAPEDAGEITEHGGRLYDRTLFKALRKIPVARQIGWMTDVEVEPPNLLVPLRRITPFRLSTFRLACDEETGPGLIVASLESRWRHPEVGEGLLTSPKSFWQGRECYEVKTASLQTLLGPVNLRELPWKAVYLYEYRAPEERLLRARTCEQGGDR